MFLQATVFSPTFYVFNEILQKVNSYNGKLDVFHAWR